MNLWEEIVMCNGCPEGTNLWLSVFCFPKWSASTLGRTPGAARQDVKSSAQVTALVFAVPISTIFHAWVEWAVCSGCSSVKWSEASQSANQNAPKTVVKRKTQNKRMIRNLVDICTNGTWYPSTITSSRYSNSYFQDQHSNWQYLAIIIESPVTAKPGSYVIQPIWDSTYQVWRRNDVFKQGETIKGEKLEQSTYLVSNCRRLNFSARSSKAFSVRFRYSTHARQIKGEIQAMT